MYSNTKKGFKSLFIAAILMFLSDFTSLFQNKDQAVLKYIGLALSVFGIIAFFLNMHGLKLCAQDDSGYHQAYRFAVIGFIVTIIGTVIGAIFDLNWVKEFTTMFESFCEFMVVWQILNTSAYIMEKKGNEALVKKANSTAFLYLISFIIALCLSYFRIELASGIEQIFVVVIALITLVIAVVSEVKYFLFLKDMKNAL